jgi:hypothetical protein
VPWRAIDTRPYPLADVIERLTDAEAMDLSKAVVERN